MSVLGKVFGAWGRGQSAPASLEPLPADASAEELVREDFVMIFKHSTACPVSWAAYNQVKKFLEEHPEAPVKLVRVIQERPLSQRIAAVTGVTHQSPQVIALRAGEVLAAPSHGEITAAALTELLQTSVTEKQPAS